MRRLSIWVYAPDGNTNDNNAKNSCPNRISPVLVPVRTFAPTREEFFTLGRFEKCLDNFETLFLGIRRRIRIGCVTTNHHWWHADALSVRVGISKAIAAAAIFLLIKTGICADLVLPVCHGLCLPIINPIVDAWIFGRSTDARVVHLRRILPTACCICGRKPLEALLKGMECGPLEAHVKTHATSLALLWAELHALGTLIPLIHIIVTIYKRDAQLLCIAHVLLLPDLVLLPRMDVGIVKENRHV
mmetsp:Transcript_56736/g.91811  ORF Transcript_56736/g.91811 Transcript_56736/m.91811 type:complete len:245 (-) Transcript_56736:106-840(-)